MVEVSAGFTSNSLPEMAGSRGFVRVVGSACLAALFVVPAHVSVAHAVAPGSAGAVDSAQPPKDRTTRLAVRSSRAPGARFLERPAIVRNAVAALTILMGTEDTRTPSYVAMRRLVSDDVAARMDLDPARLDAAWSKSPRDHQVAVLAAMTQMEVRYLEGSEEPYGKMDCSGLLWYAWRTAGVDMPRQAVSQLDPRMRIERKDALAGDVVGYGTHVHIYLGVDAAMIHAPFSGRAVRLKHMPESQLAISAWANPSNIATYRL